MIDTTCIGKECNQMCCAQEKKWAYRQGRTDMINEFSRELFRMKMPLSWFAIQQIVEKLKNQMKEQNNG